MRKVLIDELRRVGGGEVFNHLKRELMGCAHAGGLV